MPNHARAHDPDYGVPVHGRDRMAMLVDADGQPLPIPPLAPIPREDIVVPRGYTLDDEGQCVPLPDNATNGER